MRTTTDLADEEDEYSIAFDRSNREDDSSYEMGEEQVNVLGKIRTCPHLE